MATIELDPKSIKSLAIIIGVILPMVGGGLKKE